MRQAAACGIGLLLAAGAADAKLDCVPCHREIAASFAGTAHANASRQADAASILGPFEAGKNQMDTRLPGVYFRMERRPEGFYQTGVEGRRTRSERFDLVIGSGRRGQSYLYWRNRLLFQLPVSYHVGSGRWINSPGYIDGEVHFERGIPPQCLDCHATRFRLERTAGGVRYAGDYTLGIGCAKCHGEAETHDQIRRPANLELCARCHSGLEEEKTPQPDVHGNQVGLLRASRCFQKSPAMTCATCHDVHKVERDVAAMSQQCASCHTDGTCAVARAIGPAARGRCVDCHMPVLPSKLIEVQSYRTHRIGVYRKK